VSYAKAAAQHLAAKHFPVIVALVDNTTMEVKCRPDYTGPIAGMSWNPDTNALEANFGTLTKLTSYLWGWNPGEPTEARSTLPLFSIQLESERR